MTPTGPAPPDSPPPDLASTLVGVDGLDEETPAPPPPDPGCRLVLAPESAERIRAEIARAGGREVCFLAEVDSDRSVVNARAVARGNRAAVLAVARDAPEGGIMIHNHPSGVLEPSDADLSVAARVWEEGLGTALTDNEANRLYVVVEPPAPRESTPLDLDRLTGVIGPGGALAARHPAWEDRAGQREMLRLVGERYNEGGIALVEAGTGTGKSLAYLLPAAEWALRNGERTVISTATINLQEQLVSSDLPLVDDLLGGGLTWALVKGRGNYVSIRRAYLAAGKGGDLFEDDRTQELEAIREWIETTDDGSLADLPHPPSEEVWDEVRSDPDACLRARCPHFQQCFFQRSRRRAASAQLLIVNHHILFTDLAVRRATGNWTQSAVLPPWKHLVLDEAHNVEDAATENLGASLTDLGLRRALARLDRRGKGILNALAGQLRGDDGELAMKLRARIEERLRPGVEEARARARLFFEAIVVLVPEGPGDSDAVRIGAGEGVIAEPDEHEEVRERLDGLLGVLQRLSRELHDLRRMIEHDEPLHDALEGRLLDLRGAERRLTAADATLRLVLRPGDRAPELVRWLERRGKGRRRSLVLAAAPIELGPTLRESLFSKVRTLALTSATLSTRRGFGFVRARLGLDTAGLDEMEHPVEVVERIVPSPFDFARQAVLFVPTGLPDAASGDEALQRSTAEVIRTLTEVTDGGVFGLFTSHRALRRVAEHLREAGVDLTWPLFVHGERPRAALLADFVASGRGVLLGTASFWEGVDVPGDPLRGLVIQKIPFRVPTEPVTAARVEALERRGGNAFHEYALPLAALRLKQGFGRLIRSRTDRGAILLLDDRIVRRSYGRVLRDSLPDAPFVKAPWEDVQTALRRFYDAPVEGL
ncbi:MAG: helicase C-terminal domain-containing protein [Longimicrobiales bacterium]|nr:helicase C-terminal domain-containing protein [Longimicrobiales bacterium]